MLGHYVIQTLETLDNGTCDIQSEANTRAAEGCVVFVSVCTVCMYVHFYTAHAYKVVCVQSGRVNIEVFLECLSLFGFSERPSVLPAVSALTGYTLTGPTLTAS